MRWSIPSFALLVLSSACIGEIDSLPAEQDEYEDPGDDFIEQPDEQEGWSDGGLADGGLEDDGFGEHAEALTSDERGAYQIVYVKMDGVTVRDAPGYSHNPANNRSWLIGAHWRRSAVRFAPYRGHRRTVMDYLRRRFRGFDIELTQTRPSRRTPYTMLVIGQAAGRSRGVGPIDCGNRRRRDVAFVYKTRGFGARRVARMAAHELGHAFGLSHVRARGAIMHWTARDGNADWRASHFDTGHPAPKCYRGSVQHPRAILGRALSRR